MLHVLNVALWSAALLLLLPPLWRSVRRRPRYLDSLWVVCLVGTCNRLALAAFDAPCILADLAAVSLAVLFIAVMWSYQRADR